MYAKTAFCTVCLAIIYLFSSQLQLVMDTFSQNMEDILNSGDQEVRTWFLVRNNYLPFLLCGFYAIFSSIIGPALMRYRKPFELRKVMVVFNFFVVTVYTLALLVAFWYLPTVPRERFCKGVDILKKGTVEYTLASTGWVVYLLKYIEFVDTVFFVLRKKDNQITFLHVVHHTLVPICGWIMFRTEKSGFNSIPPIINAIVHVIMYSYYGLSALGPGVRKYLWWKKYLTQLQMIQFCLILLFVAVVAPLSGCTMVLTSYCIDFAVPLLFLHLFYKFYKSSFHSKTKLVETNQNAKNGSFKNRAIENEISTNGGNKNDRAFNGASQIQE